jgi:hypothetical protein
MKTEVLIQLTNLKLQAHYVNGTFWPFLKY